MREQHSGSLFGTGQVRRRRDRDLFVRIKSHGRAYRENDDRRIQVSNFRPAVRYAQVGLGQTLVASRSSTGRVVRQA